MHAQIFKYSYFAAVNLRRFSEQKLKNLVSWSLRKLNRFREEEKKFEEARKRVLEPAPGKRNRKSLMKRPTQEEQSAPKRLRYTTVPKFDYAKVTHCPICNVENKANPRAFSEHLEDHLTELLKEIPEQAYAELVAHNVLQQVKIRTFLDSLEEEDFATFPSREKYPTL
jgi:hypothetical protein